MFVTFIQLGQFMETMRRLILFRRLQPGLFILCAQYEVLIRASNEGSRRFRNHREEGLHLVESTY